MKIKYYLFLIIVIILLNSFVFASSNKISKVSNDDYNIQTKEIIKCNRPNCIINVELCKKNENKLYNKEMKLYFDEKTKKTKNKIKSKKQEVGCENIVFDVSTPLFSIIKYGLLYEGLDLDPFINNTFYEANFSIDVNSSSAVVITDNNVSSNSTLDNGLISYWTHDGDDVHGTTSDDYMGNNNGTLVNGVIANVTGILNEALEYDGIDDYVSISNQDMQDLSVSAWIKMNGSTDAYGLLVSINNYGWGFYTTMSASHNVLAFGKVYESEIQSTLEINDSDWHFVGVTYTDGSLVFYLDNQSDSYNYNKTFGSSGGDYSIGARGNSQTLNGSIDEVGLWNRVLSSNEMIELYNSGSPINQPPFTGTGLFYSDTFEVNGTMTSFTPSFNSQNAVLNISFDNGSSYFNNVTSGTNYSLSNSSYMVYNIYLSNVGDYLSDFTLPLVEVLETKLSIGLYNHSLQDYNVIEGDEFFPYANYTNNSNIIINGANCVGTFNDDDFILYYNSSSNNYVSINPFNLSYGNYTYNVSCSKSGYEDGYNSSNFIVQNLPPLINITEIDTIYDGLQSFYGGIIVTTFANYSVGNITASVFDFSNVFSNITLFYSNGSFISEVINQTIISFNLTAGNYNISVFADDNNLNSSSDSYFVVSQCVEDWVRVDSCIFPDTTTIIDYDDNNDCGTFDSLPADNGTQANCSYVSIEGDITCLANEKPLIKLFDNIEWFCYLNNTGGTQTRCISYVAFNDNIIQTNPKPEYVDQIGLVDYFTAQPENSEYQTVSVYFDSKDLIHNEMVTFGVRCNSQVVYYDFSMNVTPQFKELSRTVGDRTIWLGENASFIILTIFGFIILMIILGYAFKKFKEG